MTCPVCERPTKDGEHGACVERLVAALEKLRAMLADAGYLTRRIQDGL